MTYKKYFELSSQLNKNGLSSIYYLWGEEHLLQEIFLKQIENILSPENLDKTIFYGTNFNIDEFISTISSMSLFGTKRLVIIKEANKIKKSIEKIIADIIIQKKFSSYIVFVNPEKIRQIELEKNELIKTVSKIGGVLEFRQPYQRESVNFILDQFKKNNKIISQENAEYFYQIAGDNLFDLKNEIEKLVLFTNSRNEITTDDIYICSGFMKQENIYQLTEAVLDNDKKQILILIDNLINAGTEVLFLFNLLYKSYHKILTAYILFEKGIPKETISRKIKYYGSNLLEKVKKFNYQEILKKLELLYNTELAIKSGKIENPDMRVVVAELFSEPI